jgi:hypothetical protein
VENYGVPADVWLANNAGGFLAGRAAQLAKAVEILKGALKRVPGKNNRATRGAQQSTNGQANQW